MTWLICASRRRILYYYYCTPLPRSGFSPETLRPGVYYGINPFVCAGPTAWGAGGTNEKKQELAEESFAPPSV